MTQVTIFNMESLPKQFVSAMRTLFDIMDDKRTGYVKVTDIENRWRDDRTKGLPRGVIESLQKVASHDGLLTFERFCSGLRICLLRNQVEHASNKADRLNDDTGLHTQIISAQVHRPPSAPLLDSNDTQNLNRNWNAMKNSETSSQHQHRTISMPQLTGRKETTVQETPQHNAIVALKQENSHRIYGPPKPPRLEKQSIERKETSRQSYKSVEEIVFDTEEVEVKLNYEDLSHAMEEHSRGLGDGRSSNETQSQFRRTSRRREPRRHTLHNGVDYNLLKRMKQIEQEKDVLLQGLSAVEEAREWYLKQLTEVQDKMRYAGRMGAYVVSF